MFISHCLHKAMDILLPRTCLLCGCLSHRDIDLCAYCEELLPTIQYRCRACSISLPESSDQRLCGQCLKQPLLFDATFALFEYQTPLKKLLLDFKFQRQRHIGFTLGSLMAKHMSTTAQPDLIIPMPLHRHRLHTRGYNQALELAKPIAKELNIPLVNNIAIRSKATAKQTDLNAKQRQRNVVEAFTVKTDLSHLHITIVDDIFTSGATANELTRALLKARATSVSVWCCARAVLD